MEDQPTRVLQPRGAGRPPGREPDAVYRRRRLIAASAGAIVFLLLIVLIASAGGGDSEPDSEPADLGVGGTPRLTTPDTDRDRTNTSTGEDTTATPVEPTTPPAGTGGTPAPVAPAPPAGTGGGAGQPTPAPTAPEGEGGGAAAPPGGG